jgi:hypothetical protein
MYRKLEELIRNLKRGFYGQIEVGIQNGKPTLHNPDCVSAVDVEATSRDLNTRFSTPAR